MTRQIVLTALALALPVAATAAPGDYVLVHGTVADKGSTVIVLKADSGKSFYVLASSDATVSALRTGDAISVRGVEGAYPNEIKADGVDPDAARRASTRALPTPMASTTVSYKDWRLPALNRYETYNQSSGAYTPVEVASLSSHLDAGENIYDRTREQWVQHPSVGGRNKAYLEGGAADPGAVLVHGDWRLPRGNRYERYDGATGNYTQVDLASVPGRLDKGELIFDRTEKKWVQHPSVGNASTYKSARVQGRVQSVEGHTLTITGDDGKAVAVDTTGLKPEALRGLRWGQAVEVAGSYDAKRTKFTATGLEAGR